MRQWIYGVGSPLGNEEIYVWRYEEHNAAVVEYFAKRPPDLLVLDVTKGDGWPLLCGFLGLDVPDVPFPHENSKEDRERKKKEIESLRWA